MLKLKKPITPYQKIMERVEASRKEKRDHFILHLDGDNMVERHLCYNSGFCRAMVRQGYLTWEEMWRAAARYKLGMARDGGVIFWQIDHLNDWHDGKIMYYKEDGHRDHYHHPTWVQYQLRRFYLSGIDLDIDIFNKEHCLFGLHILGDDYTTPVAVVESEKTAVVMSERCPKYRWVASGGMSALTYRSLITLHGRKVILFPDTDENGTTYQLWCEQVRKAKSWFNKDPITVSSFLEEHASPDQKRRKIDIMDYYFESYKRPK